MTRAIDRIRFLSQVVCWAGFLMAPAAQAANVPALDHVLVIVMENKNYDQVRTAPYIAQLLTRGASFSNYRAIMHPSQPNYVALWSGSTQNVMNNQCPASGTPWMAENLGHLCEAKGLEWRSYAEELPAAGATDCQAASGLYSRKHDPWTNFGNLNHQNERPYADLALDITAGKLPALAFVIPDNNNNMHSSPVSVGDTWLSKNMPRMLDAVGPNGIVVLTWDEDDHGSANQILTVIVGAPVQGGFVSVRAVTHYTLLRTICDALRLPSPGAAALEDPIKDIWLEAQPAAANGAVNPAGGPSAGTKQ